MDVDVLKRYMINNPSTIEKVLIATDFHHIADRGTEYRCAKGEDDNPTSVRVDKETLSTQVFSSGINGDIITLVMEKKGLNFRKALIYIADILGLKEDDFYTEEVKYLPFGGFFKDIECTKDNSSHLDPIDESILDEYYDIAMQMFLDDGISVETQKKYGIRYDVLSGRIAIPHYSLSGDLVGVIGRWNGDASQVKNKYIPITKPFAKHKTLFGYKQNYNSIIDHKIAFIGESEKFPMQLDSMDIYTGLGVSGDYISRVQANNIQALLPNIVIVCFDEGLEEEFIRERAMTLKLENNFVENKVGYIFDSENKYLPKGSKCSPSDLGKEVFLALVRECVVWI